jgi:arginine decarboxylase
MSTSLVYVPKEAFLTNGVGRHKEKLQSFEMALRDAGIASMNLVRVSSIFPPHCRLIDRKRGVKKLKAGGITFCVISDNATNEPHRLVAASVGLAVPKDPNKYGYLSEHHSFGQTDKTAGDYAEDLAASMLATILGLPFDPDKSWNETKEYWKISGEIVSTRNVVQSAIGHKDGLWTTVVAAAVFV